MRPTGIEPKTQFHEYELAIYKFYDFDLREQRILEFVLQATLARGRPSVHIPKEDYFNRGAGINSRGNTNVILRRLIQSYQVIEEHPPDYYGFRMPWQNWKVALKQKITGAVLEELLGLEYNRDDLQGALRETFLENQNLPTRHPTNEGPVVRPSDRSDRPPDVATEEMGGVVSRESAGSGRAGDGEPVVAAGKEYPSPPSFAKPKAVPEVGTGSSGSRSGNPERERGPARVYAAVPEAGTDSLLEISNLGSRARVAFEDGTRLSRRARAQFEQQATERAQAVAVQYRGDQYLFEKLCDRRRLREELYAGKTPTARKFAVLYATKPQRAREIFGAAILAGNPAANLNVRLQAEGVRY